eukprot:12101-Heterococcus_DN1.PRE.4
MLCSAVLHQYHITHIACFACLLRSELSACCLGRTTATELKHHCNYPSYCTVARYTTESYVSQADIDVHALFGLTMQASRSARA